MIESLQPIRDLPRCRRRRLVLRAGSLLRSGRLLDERRDPVLATDAAIGT